MGPGARLDPLEGGDDAGLKNVEPARDVKTGDIDRAAEIVPGAELVGRGVADDLIEERLPGRKIGIADERQMQPVRRVDERLLGVPRRVEPGPAPGGRGGGMLELGGADAEPRHDRLAM